MPELPEVETVRCILEPQLAGRTIRSVEIRNPQVIAHPDAGQFAALLPGQTIVQMSRRGKFLTLHFAGGGRLCLHLRMSGQLLVMPADAPAEKHTHLILTLSDGRQLRYIDMRRFGRFWYFGKDETDDSTGLPRLGPEPDDPALTAAYLQKTLGGCRRPIKEALHDQTVVAGIGNIYSDEILFAAGIYPGTKCSALAAEDWARLAAQIPRIIRWGIDANRTTPEEYLRGRGKEYRNITGLRAYGRAGQPCTVCGCTMEKMTVAGRTSCFCPQCQRKPE